MTAKRKTRANTPWHRTIGVRLEDGTEHVFEVTRRPRFWKSWVMDQLPYSTSFYRCEWIYVNHDRRTEGTA